MIRTLVSYSSLLRPHTVALSLWFKVPLTNSSDLLRPVSVSPSSPVIGRLHHCVAIHRCRRFSRTSKYQCSSPIRRGIRFRSRSTALNTSSSTFSLHPSNQSASSSTPSPLHSPGASFRRLLTTSRARASEGFVSLQLLRKEKTEALRPVILDVSFATRPPLPQKSALPTKTRLLQCFLAPRLCSHEKPDVLLCPAVFATSSQRCHSSIATRRIWFAWSGCSASTTKDESLEC